VARRVERDPATGELRVPADARVAFVPIGGTALAGGSGTVIGALIGALFLEGPEEAPEVTWERGVTP
jgi:ABC-type xylose transport system permease subunit